MISVILNSRNLYGIPQNSYLLSIGVHEKILSSCQYFCKRISFLSLIWIARIQFFIKNLIFFACINLQILIYFYPSLWVLSVYHFLNVSEFECLFYLLLVCLFLQGFSWEEGRLISILLEPWDSLIWLTLDTLLV